MPLTANFIADFSSFINATGDATAASDKFVESAGAMGRAVDESLAATADNVKSVGAGLVDFGKQTWSVLSSDQMKQFAGDVKDFVSGFVSEFAEAEAASTRLSVALKNAGQTEATAAAYGNLATQLQSISTFSDEALTDAMTLFTTVGKVGPENMDRVLRATMDLSTNMQIDFPAAAKMMAKAAATNGESLGKLGVALEGSIEKGDDFNKVLGAVEKKMGGSFAAAADTTAGKTAILENRISDLNEEIGGVFANTLNSALDLFNQLPGSVQTATLAIVSIGEQASSVLP